MASYKPSNYNSLSAYLVVEDAKKMAAFLSKVFNATELRKYADDKGKIVHMEMKIDDTVLMMADANEAYPPDPILLHLYVPDVDQTYEAAIQHGCESIDAPRTREGDPDKRGSFRDPFGNFWSVSTQVNE